MESSPHQYSERTRIPTNISPLRCTTHKVAVVRTLMSRAKTLSSSGVQRMEEEKIVDVLKENGSFASTRVQLGSDR